MEDLACKVGLSNLDDMIKGSFTKVQLKGCVPRASLEFYQKVVDCCPDNFVFIAGGYASYLMGLKSDFSNVDIYILMANHADHLDIIQAIDEKTQNVDEHEWQLGRTNAKCDQYVYSIYPHDTCQPPCKVSTVDVNLTFTNIEYHGFHRDAYDRPIGWERYAELEESGSVPKSNGRYRYVEMLERVMQFDIFQSMCIIDSVDLKNGQCSAIALHEFQDAVADIDEKSLYVNRKCDRYVERLDRGQFARVMFGFWSSMQERYKKYQTDLPNPKIVTPSPSNLSWGKLLENRDMDEVYEYQKPWCML